MAFVKRHTPWTLLAALALLLVLLASLGWWQSTSVGPQVQVPMFYDAHYLFPRAWTQAQEAPGVPEPSPLAFYGVNQVRQSFVNGADRLAMVEIWLAGEGETAVFLTTPSETYTANLVLDDENGRYYHLTFPPQSSSQNQRYTLTLAAPNATAEKPVVTRTIGGDRLGGSILLNEFSRPGNLELHTYGRGLIGGWWFQSIGEQLLPDRFQLRLQQYKPTSFKGTVFAWLVGSLIVLSGVFLVLALPTDVSRKGAKAQREEKNLGVLSPLRDQFSKLGWGAVVLLSGFLLWQLLDGRLSLPLITPTIALTPTTTTTQTTLSDALRLVNDLATILWTAEREPEARLVETDLIGGLPAIRVPTNSRLNYTMTLPQNGRLRTGVYAPGFGSLRFIVRWNGEIVAEGNGSKTQYNWLDVDLAPWGGQGGVLTLETVPDHLEPVGVWLQPQLLAATDWLLPSLNGIAHTPANFQFDEGVRLLGVAADPAQPGEWTTVRLFWQIEQPTSRFATVFVHLLDDADTLLAQHDAQPVSNSYPLPNWPSGVVVVDEHPLLIPSDLAAGDYHLAIGLYNPSDFARWSVRDADGNLLPEGRALLETAVSVTVSP
ncbi:MAG: hypothetical protein AAF614_02200 [Chloroflexota bacterium]